MQGKEKSFANSLQQTGTLSSRKCSEVTLVRKHFQGAHFRKGITLHSTSIQRFSKSTLACACAAIFLAACGSGGGSGDVALDAQSSASGGAALTQGANAAAASTSNAYADQFGAIDPASPSTPANAPATQVVTDTTTSPASTPGIVPTQTNNAEPAPVQQGPELCKREGQTKDVQAA